VTDKTREALKRAAFRHLIENGIKTDDELWFVVHEIFGVNIPRETCCDEHQPMWEAVCDDFFYRVRKQALRHCRGGGKTFQVGVTKAAKLVAYPGLRVSNFAATENQASALFNYVQQKLGASADSEVRRLVSEVYGSTAKTNPRPVPGRAKPEGSVMRVLIGTLKGVNSAHVDDLVVDERAQMSDEVFKESMGMMTAAAPYPGILTVLSTVKQLGDPMDVLMEEAEEKGYKTYVSCILDVTNCQETSCDKCKRARSYTEDRRDSKSFYEFCRGRLMGRNLGHFSVDTALNKFTEMGLEASKAQLLCQTPEGEETAFPQFNPDVHVVEFKGDPNQDFFVFGDFGKRDDTAWIKSRMVTHKGHRAIHMIDERIGKGKTMEEDWIPILKDIGWHEAQAFLVDIAGLQTTVASKRSAIEQMTDQGWTVLYDKCDELETTERVRVLLKSERLLVDPKCKKVIQALERSSNASTGANDNKIFLKVIKHNKYSHPIDAIRYGTHLLLPDDNPEPPKRMRPKGR
jgi:hypothetical protein